MAIVGKLGFYRSTHTYNYTLKKKKAVYIIVIGYIKYIFLKV